MNIDDLFKSDIAHAAAQRIYFYESTGEMDSQEALESITDMLNTYFKSNKLKKQTCEEFYLQWCARFRH